MSEDDYNVYMFLMYFGLMVYAKPSSAPRDEMKVVHLGRGWLRCSLEAFSAESCNICFADNVNCGYSGQNET